MINSGGYRNTVAVVLPVAGKAGEVANLVPKAT